MIFFAKTFVKNIQITKLKLDQIETKTIPPLVFTVFTYLRLHSLIATVIIGLLFSSLTLLINLQYQSM